MLEILCHRHSMAAMLPPVRCVSTDDPLCRADTYRATFSTFSTSPAAGECCPIGGAGVGQAAGAQLAAERRIGIPIRLVDGAVPGEPPRRRHDIGAGTVGHHAPFAIGGRL